MQRVTIEDVEAVSPPDEEIPDGAMAEAIGRVRKLSDPLGTERMAVNHYELDPGESVTMSAHSHSTQEELFVVQDGTVTFETEGEPVTVRAGQLLSVPPGTFQLGTNRGEEPAAILALGAPREYDDGGRWKFECDECDAYTTHALEERADGDEGVYRCQDCGTVFE